MKQTAKRTICYLLIVLMCLSLAACGRTTRGGLGTLEMDGKDNIVSSDEPRVPPEPTEPVEDPPSGPEPQNPSGPIAEGYSVCANEGQDFSILVDENYSSVASAEEGTSIYPVSYGNVPYIRISSYKNAGMSEEEYFDTCIKSNQDYYGSDLSEISDVQTYTYGSRQIQGVKFAYYTEGNDLEMLCMAEVSGVRLNVFITKYIPAQKETAEATMNALSIAVQSFQPSASYYDGTESTTPVPPTQPGSPQQPIETEIYEDEYVKLEKPVGWVVEVIWTKDPVLYAQNPDYGVEEMNVIVYHPENPNNMFFDCDGFCGIFDTEEAKAVYLPLLPEEYRNAPVLREFSAAGTLKQWNDFFELIKINGLSSYFANYTVKEILEEEERFRYEEDGRIIRMQSTALASVSIPNESETYTVYLYNTLRDLLSYSFFGFPEDVPCYKSFYNKGWVLSEEKSYMAETMEHCLGCIQNKDWGRGD